MRGTLGKPWIGTLDIEDDSITLTDEHGSDSDIETYLIVVKDMKIEARWCTDCPAYDDDGVPRSYWNGTYTHGDNCDCNVWLELTPVQEADRG